jgi:hypothetical protein
MLISWLLPHSTSLNLHMIINLFTAEMDNMEAYKYISYNG